MTTEQFKRVPFEATCLDCAAEFRQLDECYEHTTDTGHSVEAISEYEIVTYKASAVSA